MKAMMLAAGLGTRLRPLTDERPKPLVEIAGLTLLELTLRRLEKYGVREVIINVHHFADKILAYLQAHGNFGMRIEISREDELLDTGGGLKEAAWFFLEDSATRDEPFILHNVDVLTSIDLHRMVQAHKGSNALATLAVQKRDSSRQLLFDEQLHLCGRAFFRDQIAEKSELVRPSPKAQAFAFTGVHVISPKFLTMMQETGAFSVIDTYLRLASGGENLLAFRADEYYWRDLGRPEDLKQAAEDLKQNKLS
jgi:NDP-sugar pyrophosphorylase family protein